MNTKIRDSLVGLASGYGLDSRGSIPGKGKIIILFSTASRPALGTNQPPIQWVPGGFSPGVKWQNREPYPSPLSSADVESSGVIPSLHHVL
jgi:hypothetical protein